MFFANAHLYVVLVDLNRPVRTNRQERVLFKHGTSSPKLDINFDALVLYDIAKPVCWSSCTLGKISLLNALVTTRF